MFESADTESVRDKSSTLHIIAVFVILAVAVGGGAYWFYKSRTTLATDVAAELIKFNLRSMGAATTHIHTGVLKSDEEKASDLHYKLLEQAGLIEIKKEKKGALVQLTLRGKDELDRTPELKKWKNPDDTTALDIPLANRQLVEVKKIELIRPGEAKVTFSWKWIPNKFGEIFDADNPEIQKLSQAARLDMIKKHGVDFYKGQAHEQTVSMRLSEKGWRID